MFQPTNEDTQVANKAASDCKDHVCRLVGRQVRVVRGGKQRSISTYDLLVGDVLVVDTGDILPADCLLFESSNLRCVLSCLFVGHDVPFTLVSSRLRQSSRVALPKGRGLLDRLLGRLYCLLGRQRMCCDHWPPDRLDMTDPMLWAV